MIAHDVVIAAGAAPERSFVLLHGILGSGQNLRTIARRFVAERPRWAAVLVDLRRHGASLDAPGPDTLEQAALDVAELAASLTVPAGAVLGHSFGGKVALQWLAAAREQAGLEHVHVIDSNPGSRLDARGSEGTLRVVDMLDALPYPFESRDAFVQAVLAQDPRPTLAQWLAMSVRRAEDGWRFGPPIASIRALLSSYFAEDLWPIVESPPDGAHVHLVIGARSTVLDAADRTRASEIAARLPDRVTVDVLPTDHWVHAEDPDGLLRVLLERGPA
ncbi:MAG: alpha/beta fold hydrolase [Myxococcota bacterium]|nr:alpha/beta fold hydrolase [Myxococcota bacterium]